MSNKAQLKGRVPLLAIGLLIISCSLDKPVVPPPAPPPASDETFKGVQMGVRGLEYFEQFYRLRRPFQYDMVETLTVAMKELALTLSANELVHLADIQSQKLFAKALGPKATNSSTSKLAVPSPTLFSFGDSVYADSSDSFLVIVYEADNVPPVDSGYDSVYYIDTLIHHINSKLQLTGGRTVNQSQTDADGDGYLNTGNAEFNPFNSTQQSEIERYFTSGGTLYSVTVQSSYDTTQTGAPGWLNYRELTVNAGDTVIDRTIREVKSEVFFLQPNDTLHETIVTKQQDTSTTYQIKRILRHADQIRNDTADKYMSFEWSRNTATDTIHTVWTNNDSNNALVWDPMQIGYDTVWIVSNHRFSNSASRKESTLVALFFSNWDPSERIIAYHNIDSLTDGTLVDRRISSASWMHDTVFVTQKTTYGGNATLEPFPFGRINESILYYKLISRGVGTSQFADSITHRHNFSSTTEVRHILEEYYPDQPIPVSTGRCSSGVYKKYILFKDDTAIPITEESHYFSFDMRGGYAGDTLVLWKRRQDFTANDSLVQTIVLDTALNGSLTDIRTDSLKERMTFSANGSFSDSLWYAAPGTSDSLLWAISGNLDKNTNTGTWTQKDPSRNVTVSLSANQLQIGGNDTIIADTLLISLSGDSGSWSSDVDDYSFNFTSAYSNDQKISLSIEGHTDSGSVLKVESSGIRVFSNGLGAGMVREANPANNAALCGSCDDYIDYSLKIHLRKASLFSGKTLF